MAVSGLTERQRQRRRLGMQRLLGVNVHIEMLREMETFSGAVESKHTLQSYPLIVADEITRIYF